jgi:hypothetical protein
MMTLLLLVVLIGLLLGVSGSAEAQGKPFVLPVNAPPGPGTWLLGQPYGNTVGAFLRGDDWYSAGQRLHFGLDLSMPCGTELVAIGDGTVLFVDDLGFGSGPHNLLIRHDAAGVVSLYGHLLERPALNPGDAVAQGQVVARSGDPDVTCDSRPHLHLEIRSLDYFVAYNPLDTIDANWHTLAIVGPFVYPLFQQNLDHARRWMDLLDQPQVAFGGRALNDYAATYPDLRDGVPPNNAVLAREELPLATAYSARSTGVVGCCRGAFFDSGTNRLTAIDGAPDARAALAQWDGDNGLWTGPAGAAPPPFASPDGTHIISRDPDGLTRITRAEDGVAWTVDTQGAWPALSPDNGQIMWTVTRPSADTATPAITEIWVAAADGANPRGIAAADGSSAQWLDAHRLLIGRREGITTTLGVYDTRTSEAYVLGVWDWLRGLSVAPGGGRLLFYTVWDADNGLYTIATEREAQAQKLPWFGGWRWRDADTIYLAPLDLTAATTSLLIANVARGEAVPLVADAPFLIANGDWAVSADGRQLALFNALDETTWILSPSGESQP